MKHKHRFIDSHLKTDTQTANKGTTTRRRGQVAQECHNGMRKHEKIQSDEALMSIVAMCKLRLYAISGTRSLNLFARERELMRVVDT